MRMSAHHFFFSFPPSTTEEQRKHQQLHLPATQLNSNLESPFLLFFSQAFFLLSFLSFGSAYLGQ